MVIMLQTSGQRDSRVLEVGLGGGEGTAGVPRLADVALEETDEAAALGAAPAGAADRERVGAPAAELARERDEVGARQGDVLAAPRAERGDLLCEFVCRV